MSKKCVLLVVRADNPQDPKRQLEWLEQNIFPSDKFRQRTLVYVGALAHLIKMNRPWLYDHFADYQDLYSKLRGEGYFRYTYSERRSFDFAVFIHIRRDRSSGMGYGLQERAGERCLLRAVFLAARGNVLFGDWGLPLGTSPDVTRDQLLARRKMHQYVYIGVHRSRYPNLTANVPFTKVVDHFLTPVLEEDPGLPEAHMVRIREATEGKLFTDYQLKLAVWNAWWHLYFACDEYLLIYHRWIHFRSLQQAIFHLVMYVRAWTVSSSWVELVIDSIGFTIMALLYDVLSLAGETVRNGTFSFSSIEHLCRRYIAVDETIFVVLIKYIGWMVPVTILLEISLTDPEDRIPVWEKMRGFLPYSLGFALGDMVTQLWWQRTNEHLMIVVLLWAVLACMDLLSHWFCVPIQRNFFSVMAQSITVATLFKHALPLKAVAWILLEQPLYLLPFFIWGRLRLNPELKRSLVVVPWLSALVTWITLETFFV